MKIDSTRFYEGKRRIRDMGPEARDRARVAIAADDPELENYRTAMLFNYGLREKYLESLILAEQDGRIMPLLVLSGAPRGMANVIAAPLHRENRAEAEVEALWLLTAAWVAILDFKEEIRTGIADQHFRFRMSGGMILNIPHEIMRFVSNRVPLKLDDAQKEAIRSHALKRIEVLAEGEMTPEDWNELDDREQATLMEAASELLCAGFFGQDAARRI